jgi:5-methylcytosine-specific restriction endonuclease McrA
MSVIPAGLQAEVARRADDRCEYCGLSQAGQEATFHVDHVVPRVADGPTNLGNLAFACVSCSLRKGAKTTAIDPDSGEQTPLFNPRTERWADHFRWEDDQIAPLTPMGRATVTALAMNRPLIVAIRREEMARGRHPPP